MSALPSEPEMAKAARPNVPVIMITAYGDGATDQADRLRSNDSRLRAGF
jgi:hypothetical protein